MHMKGEVVSEGHLNNSHSGDSNREQSGLAVAHAKDMLVLGRDRRVRHPGYTPRHGMTKASEAFFGKLSKPDRHVVGRIAYRIGKTVEEYEQEGAPDGQVDAVLHVVGGALEKSEIKDAKDIDLITVTAGEDTAALDVAVYNAVLRDLMRDHKVAPVESVFVEELGWETKTTLRFEPERSGRKPIDWMFVNGPVTLAEFDAGDVHRRDKTPLPKMPLAVFSTNGHRK